MRIIRTSIILLLLIAAAVGCQEKGLKSMIVDITLSNNSTNTLDWVTLNWQGPEVPGGILSPGITSTAIDVEWPNLTSATLNFVDKKTRQPYAIELSLAEVNKLVVSGKCHSILIRILSYDKAEVVFGVNK